MSEEDTLPAGLIVKVLGAVIAGGILLSAVAWLVLHVREGQLGQRGPVARQTLELLFEDVPREPSSDSFAWVDRDRRLVRIPIHDAMELVAKGARP